MRVLVTGDRNWSAVYPIRSRLLQLLAMHGELVVIEGCARGADSVAHDFEYDGVSHKHFPADWERYGRAAGPVRNRQMLTEGKPEWVLAFHDNLDKSKGTKDMIAAAVKAGLTVEHRNSKAMLVRWYQPDSALF